MNSIISKGNKIVTTVNSRFNGREWMESRGKGEKKKFWIASNLLIIIAFRYIIFNGEVFINRTIVNGKASWIKIYYLGRAKITVDETKNYKIFRQTRMSQVK